MKLISVLENRFKMIYIARTFEEAQVYANRLLAVRPGILGFDTETTIGRIDDPANTSLIQISTDKECYLFQVYRIFQVSEHLPKSLIKLLQTPEIVKVGVDLAGDIKSLEAYGITLRGAVDIQLIARTLNIPELSLDGLGRRFITRFPGKSMLNYNWNWDDDLSRDQILYASADAVYSLLIYGGMIPGVNVITPLTVEDSQKEAKDYLTWVIENVPMKYDSILNKTINSYGLWTKQYTRAERQEKSRTLLNGFINDGHITINVITRELTA